MTFYHVRRTHSQYSLNILFSFNDDAASPPRLLKSGSGFAAAHAVVASGECETGGRHGVMVSQGSDNVSESREDTHRPLPRPRHSSEATPGHMWADQHLPSSASHIQGHNSPVDGILKVMTRLNEVSEFKSTSYS